LVIIIIIIQETLLRETLVHFQQQNGHDMAWCNARTRVARFRDTCHASRSGAEEPVVVEAQHIEFGVDSTRRTQESQIGDKED
jgi:hypothetical protein